MAETKDPLWESVDDYAARRLIAPDATLDNAISSTAAAGLPAIAVSPLQGAMLHALARATKPRAILEIGTLGAYSTIWLARALEPGGRMITLEYAQKHADVARRNVDKAGLGDRVDIRIGKAIDSLPSLAGPFDFVFIDADKPSTTEYFQWAVKLSRSGSLIVVDNVVRDGGIADGSNRDPDVVGMRRFLEAMSRESRVTGTLVQTVGAKGYDGFALAVVK
jgi:predicted O-methyltransferase YrrM